MRFWTNSLVARLVGYFLLLSILSATLLPLVTFVLSRGALRQSVFDRLDVAATLKEIELNRWVEANKQDVLVIAADPRIDRHAWRLLTGGEDTAAFRVAYDALKEFFVSLMEIKTSLEEVAILSEPDGRVVLSSDMTHEGEFLSTYAYFTQGRLDTYIQNAYISPVTGKSTMTISTPLFDPTGNLIGVLAAHLNLENLDRVILERTGLGESGETYLINKDNAFVSEARFEGNEYIYGIHTEGVEAALQGKDGSGIYPNYQGVQVLGVYRWIEDRELALLTEISEQEAFAPARRLAFAIFAVGLVAVVVLSGGAFLFSRQIAHPILAITDAATKVAAGDLTQTAPVLTRDEIGKLATTFNDMTAQLRNLVGKLEERVVERTRQLEYRAVQLEAAAEVGSAVASFRNLDHLLNQVTYLISERFRYYHVAIFLLDESGENIVLRAANSEGGRRMLARGHMLRVGHEGIVGYVAGSRQPRIAMDVGQDAVFFGNPDLPHTHSELALPLIAGGQLSGVLDVQSEKEAAFTEDDIATLQVLADLVAVAIENARLFTETQAALDASRRAYGEVSGQAWERIIRFRSLGYLCDRRDQVRRVSGDWSPEMEKARQSGQAVHVNGHTIALPIKIHEQPMGVIRLRKSEDAGEWTQRELDLIDELIDQLAIALENARLYEDTQRRAHSERILTEITSKVRASTNIEVILQTAVQELAEALHVPKGKIQLRSTGGGNSDE